MLTEELRPRLAWTVSNTLFLSYVSPSIRNSMVTLPQARSVSHFKYDCVPVSYVLPLFFHELPPLDVSSSFESLTILNTTGNYSNYD